MTGVNPTNTNPNVTNAGVKSDEGSSGKKFQYGVLSGMIGRTFIDANELRASVAKSNAETLKANTELKMNRADKLFSAAIQKSIGQGVGALTQGVYSGRSMNPSLPGNVAPGQLNIQGNAAALTAGQRRDAISRLSTSFINKGQAANAGSGALGGFLGAFEERRAGVLSAESDRLAALERNLDAQKGKLGQFLSSLASASGGASRWALAAQGR